jgi:hypothetical protein
MSTLFGGTELIHALLLAVARYRAAKLLLFSIWPHRLNRIEFWRGERHLSARESFGYSPYDAWPDDLFPTAIFLIRNTEHLKWILWRNYRLAVCTGA